MGQLSMCRQGLVLVENGEGALAMGGIDQQYQVSSGSSPVSSGSTLGSGTIVISLQILVNSLHPIICCWQGLDNSGTA